MTRRPAHFLPFGCAQGKLKAQGEWGVRDAQVSGWGCTGFLQRLDEQRSKDKGYYGHELYQDIEGRAAGVFERVAHCITNHGGVVRL